jgi:3-mercaptopyruvate sulfurtransferase SseA
MANKRKNRSVVPVALIGIGVILILGALAWYINATSAKPSTVPVAADAQEGSDSQVTRVSLADAKAAYDSGSAVFLDVRDAEAYEASHIPGAILIPVYEVQDRIDELDPSAWIITYCT